MPSQITFFFITLAQDYRFLLHRYIIVSWQNPNILEIHPIENLQSMAAGIQNIHQGNVGTIKSNPETIFYLVPDFLYNACGGENDTILFQ